MRDSSRLAVFFGLVILAGLLIYLPGLPGPLFFDDKPALTANEGAQIDGASFDEWRVAAFSSRSGPLRRPVAMLSFAANHAIAGHFSPVGLKAVNLAVHLSIAVIIYFFFRTLLDALNIGRDSSVRQLIAIIACGLWVLHPLHVSTVLYAVQRMAQLSTLFVVSGLLVFARYRLRWSEQGAHAGEVMAAAMWLLLLMTLAVLSKENGVLLAWLVIVVEVVVFRGMWAGKPSSFLQWAAWILLILPILLVVIIFAVSPDMIAGGYAGREFTLEERVLTQARLLWRYLGWICWPDISQMSFHHDDIVVSRGLFQPLTTFLALLGWPLCLGLAFWFRKRYPLVLLGLLFYLVGHSMESSVIPLEMVYEHRNYLPSMMVFLALAATFVIPIVNGRHTGIWYPLSGVLAMLCVLLFIRVQNWSDELTLSRVNVEQHPQSSRSNYFYANALLRRYRRSEQLGLNQQERGELLLLSRHYFERMYQSNDRDVAALVMLYFLDSKYFPQLRERVNWLPTLETLLETKTLQPSDWNALDLLIECFALGPCMATKAQVTELLDKLLIRYPRSLRIVRYRYLYLSLMDAEPSELLPLLHQAWSLAPDESWVYRAFMLEYGRNQDAVNLYEFAQLWLLNDPQRYNVHVLKALFTVPETSSGQSDD